jgi:glycosyltransferase involved in cell wall biosynthesis
MPEAMVSIIVPCYNYGHYLAETLRCIQNQSYRNFECIVVDDGSTDNSAAVTDTFVKADARYHYIRQHNQGLSAARNTGLANAQGEWIQFLDADDLIHYQKIELQLAAVNKFPSASVFFSDYTYFYGDAGDVQESVIKKINPSSGIFHEVSPDQALDVMRRENLMVVNAPIVSVKTVRELQIFFDTSYQSLEDWHFWFRLAASNVTFIKGRYECPLALVRKHATSMSMYPQRMLNAHLRLMDTVNEHFRRTSKPEDYAGLARSYKNSARYFRSSIVFDEIQRGRLMNGIRLAIAETWRSPADLLWYAKNILYSVKVRLQSE